MEELSAWENSMGALFAPVELSEEDIAEVFKIEQPISEGDDNMGLLAAPSNLFTSSSRSQEQLTHLRA